jgi:hypothetical protein
MGLYAVGRPDPELRQLEHAIIAEKRTHQLRIASVESLLSLAELKSEYDVQHEDIPAILHPSGPSIDPVVGLMTRLVAERGKQTPLTIKERTEDRSTITDSREGEPAFWLTPVKDDEKGTPEERVRILVGQERIYAFGDRTPGRKHLRPGDWICFYANAKDVVAHAKAASLPERKPTHWSKILKCTYGPFAWRMFNFP